MSSQSAPAIDSQDHSPGMFVGSNGKSLVVTFCLVSSLFLLWGFCNGMIDVMDKHFQEELHLTLAQSAWVQFAHYLGYFLMALPAGWLAIKLGYKGGIIAGLLMVAAGGIWFIPATRIEAFWAFLLGVCLIAAGLTFLETIANPYTTVLGPPRYAATRINLAQSCNGVGWIFGPHRRREVLLFRRRCWPEHGGGDSVDSLFRRRRRGRRAGSSSSISPTYRISRRKTITISTTAIRTSPTRSGPIRTLFSRSSRSFSMWPLRPAFSASSSTT